MDIKDYAEIIKKNLWIIISIVIVFMLATLVFTLRKAPDFQATATMEVIRTQNQNQSKVSYYQYDNYYSGLAANSLSDNMLGWIASPSTVADVFKKTNYPLPSGDLKSLAKIFTAKKHQAISSVVDVSYDSSDKTKAKILVQAATDILREKIDQYNSVDQSTDFNSIVNNPVVVEAPKTYTLNLLIAAFAGLLIGLSFAFVREALRK